VKLVVGGPPHSGKSTFTAALIDSVESLLNGDNYDIYCDWMTLDLEDNSLPNLMDPEEPEEHDEVDWEEEAPIRRDEFAEREAPLVIADAPGQLTEQLNTLIEPADAIILLVSEDEREKMEDWRERAEEHGIDPIFEIFTVYQSGEEPYLDGQTGRIRSVSRDEFGSHRLSAYDRKSQRYIRRISDSIVTRTIEEDF
jgi:hypothetical protein